MLELTRSKSFAHPWRVVVNTYAKISLIFLGLVVVAVLWGNRIEPRWLETTSHKVQLEHLPEEFGGRHIAFLSDFQVGMWLGNSSTIDTAVNRIIAKKPIALLIGGDFIYHPTDDDLDDVREDWSKDDEIRTETLIAEVVDRLRPLQEAEIPTFAVLGNHDYSMGHKSSKRIDKTAELLTDGLERIGIKILSNQSERIRINNQEIYVVGIAPHYPDLDDPAGALATVPPNRAKILFMHNANSLAKIPGHKFSLAIAGHTHGGQVRVPGFPHWTWMSIVPQTPDEVKGDGWIKNYKEPSNKLYVNRGVGFSSYPIRINCRPELSFFTLSR